MNECDYINQCRVKSLSEPGSTVPPTHAELLELVAYLTERGAKPVLIGSVAIFHHLALANVTPDYRPTADVDIFVAKVPCVPPGWQRDPNAPGCDSWLSPSGGTVDLLVKSHEYPNGAKNPASLEADPTSDELPVASIKDLARMKANSSREKDLADLITLLRLAPGLELGKLTRSQRENVELAQLWLTKA